MALTRSVSAVDLTFGQQALTTAGSPLITHLTNTGEASLTVRSAQLAGANPGDFVIASDDCTGMTIAPGDACALGVKFAPAALGARSARVVFQTDSVSGQAALSGEGTAAPVVESVAHARGPGRRGGNAGADTHPAREDRGRGELQLQARDGEDHAADVADRQGLPEGRDDRRQDREEDVHQEERLGHGFAEVPDRQAAEGRDEDHRHDQQGGDDVGRPRR